MASVPAMGRRVSVLAAAAAVLCLAVALLFWPERMAHADRSGARLASATDASAGPDGSDGFAVVGHRGYPGPGVTEDTVPALRRALGYGATAVELDVQLTRDGRFLVLHDPSLDRTTTCRGRVDARTLARIQERCRGRRGHELLPSLGQALDLVARRGAHVVVDLKRPPSAWSPALYDALVAQLRARGLVERTVVLGFHRATLEAVRRIEPGLRVQAIARDLEDVERMRTWADGLNLPASLATPELVGSLREQGLLVLGRKTGAESDWTLLRDAGAAGLLTGRVATYVAWRAVPAA